MNTIRPIALYAALALASLTAPSPAQAKSARPAAVLHQYTLVPTSLESFGYTAAEITAAQGAGLTVTDLPSAGSGLQHLGGNSSPAVTDRGPNVTVGSMRLFPLPQFTPTIVLLRAGADKMAIEATLPLVGQSGAGVTGIPNSATEDGVPFLSPTNQLPYNPSGMDIEDVHTLPGGKFILVEEYSPSVVIADAGGVVLRRYTPVSKTLPGADYPISNTLPDVLRSRRANRGFESMAMSPDGRTAYTLTQSPLGSTSAGSPYRDSRIVRVFRLDVSDPLNLQVTGQFAVRLSPIATFPAGSAQRDLKVSAAAWASSDALLILEVIDVPGIGGVRVVQIDLRPASNFHGLPVAATLDLEDVTKGPASFGLTPAATTVLYEEFDTEAVRLLPAGKLEGLTILNPNLIAISNDNDFGIGDVPGTPSIVTVLRLPDRLPVWPWPFKQNAEQNAE